MYNVFDFQDGCKLYFNCTVLWIGHCPKPLFQNETKCNKRKVLHLASFWKWVLAFWFGFVFLFCFVCFVLFFCLFVMLSFLIDLITWYLFVQCNAYSPFQAPSSMDCEWKEGWWVHGSSPSSTQQSHGSGWVTRQTGMLWRSIPFLPCSQGLTSPCLLEHKKEEKLGRQSVQRSEISLVKQLKEYLLKSTAGNFSLFLWGSLVILIVTSWNQLWNCTHFRHPADEQ